METFFKGFTSGNSRESRACPDSCSAVISFSFLDIIRLFFSGPISTLSTDFSKSAISTASLLYRAAKSAASLQRLARSAPEKPGVWLARDFKSTEGASFILRVCTLSISSLPLISGRCTMMWRSNLPGRKIAGSRVSGLLVAAIRINPSWVSNPSISTKSAFRVCSLSSWPPPMPEKRKRPTASISSIKIIAPF